MLQKASHRIFNPFTKFVKNGCNCCICSLNLFTKSTTDCFILFHIPITLFLKSSFVFHKCVITAIIPAIAATTIAIGPKAIPLNTADNEPNVPTKCAATKDIPDIINNNGPTAAASNESAKINF